MSANPYEGLKELSLEQLEERVGSLTPDQLTWLNAALSQELTAVEKQMEDPSFNVMAGEVDDKPEVTVVGGKSLNDITLEHATLKTKLNLVEAALQKPQEMEM